MTTLLWHKTIVNIPENLENISLHVFNGVGQEILMLDESILAGQNQIQLNQFTHFTQGVYYLTFSDQVRTHTVKLVVL